MSYPSHEPHAVEEQAPFAGHPFGGLIREDRFGVIATFEDPFPHAPADGPANGGDKVDASDDATGGFDFHLGVYSRF
ncbi:MAG: hypothetical protein M5U16_12945 [Hyphomicrobium sp.]|nr:hypothetical protein [Hyphomicrobium sp.]